MQQSETDTARVVVQSVADGRVVVTVPHTQYELELALGRAAAAESLVGKHINGLIHARALKMHHAAGGGVFIEPVQGHPRSVQGRILATDVVNNKVLAHIVVPMWVRVPQGQAASEFTTGELVNCYLESGTTLTPCSI